MSSNQKPANHKPALAVALTGSLLLTASAFAATPLVQGYMLGADAAAGDKAKEGNCGGKGAEGRCGMAAMDTDKDGRVSKAEYLVAHKNDAAKWAAHDPNGDGYIDAAEMKAHKAEGKCGEGKCGAEKDKKAAAAEGKCGEGKCGGNM